MSFSDLPHIEQDSTLRYEAYTSCLFNPSFVAYLQMLHFTLWCGLSFFLDSLRLRLRSSSGRDFLNLVAKSASHFLQRERRLCPPLPFGLNEYSLIAKVRPQPWHVLNSGSALKQSEHRTDLLSFCLPHLQIVPLVDSHERQICLRLGGLAPFEWLPNDSRGRSFWHDLQYGISAHDLLVRYVLAALVLSVLVVSEALKPRSF